jgi:hypothetical protein
LAAEAEGDAMHRARTRVFLLALLASACTPPGAAPDEVARRFWEALDAGQFAEARALSTAPDERGLRELAVRHPLERVELGQVLRNENAALVETVAVLEGARQTEIAFNTHLVRLKGGWRVEVEPTRREVLRGSLSASVDDVRDSLQESAEMLSESIERGALEFSEALREALEEIERDLRGQGSPGSP